MLKLTLPKHPGAYFGGFKQWSEFCSCPFLSLGKKECSCKGFSACPDGTSALTPWCNCFDVTSIWHCQGNWYGPANEHEQMVKLERGSGCPEFAFFPSQHCSCCLYFSGVRLAPATGPSAMRLLWSLLVFLSLVWLKAVPTFSESELWTKLALAYHPGCQSPWLLWIPLTEPGLEVRCAFCRLPEWWMSHNSSKKKKRMPIYSQAFNTPLEGAMQNQNILWQQLCQEEVISALFAQSAQSAQMAFAGCGAMLQTCRKGGKVTGELIAWRELLLFSQQNSWTDLVNSLSVPQTRVADSVLRQWSKSCSNISTIPG